MKKIIGILLIGFLGFLGCSDNDNATRTVGEANPVAPYGIVGTSTPTYKWTPVPWATKYRLVVQDTTQAATIQDTNETSIIDEWYTADEAGCSSEDGLCTVTPEIEVIGENEFKIVACANEECGLWSETLTFDFTALNGPRFTDNGDGTVTDNTTKSIWAQQAGGVDSAGNPTFDWWEAVQYCTYLSVGGYDWTLPDECELYSLFADPVMGICLGAETPPFIAEKFAGYWTDSNRGTNGCGYSWAFYRTDDGCDIYELWSNPEITASSKCNQGQPAPRAGAWCIKRTPYEAQH